MNTTTRWDETEAEFDALADFDWDAEERDAATQSRPPAIEAEHPSSGPGLFGIQPLPTRLTAQELNAWAAQAQAGSGWAQTVCARGVAPRVRKAVRRYSSLPEAEGIAWATVEATIRDWEPGQSLSANVATRVDQALANAAEAASAQMRSHELNAASVDALTDAGFDPAVTTGAADDLLADGWVVDEIQAALAALPDAERKVIEWLQGFDLLPAPHSDSKPTLERIAEVTGVSFATVRNRRDRGYDLLRAALKEIRAELLAG